MILRPENESILKQRFPQLLHALEDELGPTSWNYQEDGAVFFKNDEGLIFPYGRRCGNRLCEIWQQRQDLKSGGVYLLFGVGNASHVASLLRKNVQCKVILYEAELAWLKTLFSKQDCSSLLGDPRLILCANAEDLLKLVDFEEVETLLYTPLYEAGDFKQQYNDFLSNILAESRRKRSLRMSREQDLGLWYEETLKNLPVMLRAPDVRAMVGVFKDFPVVMVSAGPSLDDSIDFLKNIKDKAVIVCINTAFGVLKKQGVRPHITIAGDPRESTFRGYQGCEASGTYLCAPFYVNKQVADLFKGRIFTWSTSNVLVDLFYEQLNLGCPTPIDEQGTVAASIFSLCRLWGVRNLYLVGQDLAVKEDGQTHSKDSFYAALSYPPVDFDKCKKMPANNPGKSEVLVEDKLYIYLKAFEEFIKQNAELNVYNLSSQGVRIKGARFKEFDEVIKDLQENNSQWMRDKLKAICLPRENLKLDNNFLKDFLSGLLLRIFEWSVCFDKLEKMTDGEAYGIFLAKKYMQSVEDWLKRFPRDYAMIITEEVDDKVEDRMGDFQFFQERNNKYWKFAERAYALLQVLYN